MRFLLSRRTVLLLHCALIVSLLDWTALGQSTDVTDSGATNEVRESISKLKKMSLDELFNEQVTTVSRTPEKLSQAPSAVQIITGDDIQRSGATSLPEALRLASNLQVAQISSRDWAISARGFNQPGGLSDKLLVMIDGRSVYTPLFAGVFWDVQHVLLEDIDRIEVVSGPGGSLWGANAVNGVINIISKSARDTQGAYVSGLGGSFLQDYGAIRYGDSVGTNLFFRVYGQRFDQDSTIAANGLPATNSWDLTQGGFRMDWYPQDVNILTLQGDVYSGTEQAFPRDTAVDGENILGRWTHVFSPDSDLSVQTYFDRTWRNIPGTFGEDLKTYDLDFQHRFPLGSRQSILWGGSYRLQQDDVKNVIPGPVAFYPAKFNMQLFTGFVQDELTLVPDRLLFTLGTKVEHNDFSGIEVQPSGRLAWTLDERNTLWAAISRAVRSPTRIDRDYHIPATAPFFVNGGLNLVSEKVLAYELGYRVQPTRRLSLSLATFFNQYEDIRSLEPDPATGSFKIRNGLQGQSWGVELSGNFQATDWWRLRGGYTFINERVWQKPGHFDVNMARGELNDPQNQVVLQSIMNLPANFQFDLVGRYVDSLPSPNVPSYVTCDARIAWLYKNILEISLVGQNLAGKHTEFGDPATRQQIPRSIYGKVTWRF